MIWKPGEVPQLVDVKTGQRMPSGLLTFGRSKVDTPGVRYLVYDRQSDAFVWGEDLPPRARLVPAFEGSSNKVRYLAS